MDADGGLYISWTPIGMTVFKITRNKTLEAKLVDYLSVFARSAMDSSIRFENRNNTCEPLAVQLTTEIKEKAELTLPLDHWQSEIDKHAKKATWRIVKKIDGTK